MRDEECGDWIALFESLGYFFDGGRCTCSLGLLFVGYACLDGSQLSLVLSPEWKSDRSTMCQNIFSILCVLKEIKLQK